MSTVIEYGWRLDCTEEGCPILHPESGVYYAGRERPKAIRGTVGHHVAVLVRRTVTITDWELA